MKLFLWILVQWTSKMCPFHISKIFFGDKYTLKEGLLTDNNDVIIIQPISKAD